MQSKTTFITFIVILLFITVLTSCSNKDIVRVKVVQSGIIVPAYIDSDLSSVYKTGDTVWMYRRSDNNEITSVTWDKAYVSMYFDLVVLESSKNSNK
jgi:hypothetical protein